MPASIDELVPLYLNRNRVGTDVPLPIAEKNDMGVMLPHRVEPARRNVDSRTLLDGNFVQEDRLNLFGRYLIDADYASGVGSITDCVLRSIEQLNSKTAEIKPWLATGYYGFGAYDYYHYGALAEAEISTPGVEHALEYEPDPEVPMRLAIWTRGDCNEAIPHRIVFERAEDQFYGDLLSDGRDTGTASELLDQYYYDVDDNKIVYSRDIKEDLYTDVDHSLATSREIWHDGDWIGLANGTDCQFYYTKYFPIYENEGMYIYTILGTADNRVDVQFWEIVPNFIDSRAGDYHCTVDYDLGIVRFGGIRGGEAVLSTSLSLAESRAIKVHSTEELAFNGAVEISDGINSEIITYTGKTETELLGITRVGPSFAFGPGSTVTTIQTGERPASTHLVMALYTARPRIDYQEWEPKRYDDLGVLARRPNSAYTPFKLHNNESILCIDRCNQKIASIVLKPVDIDSIRTGPGEFCYGPVYMGEDIVLIEGTVYDDAGRPIPDIEVDVFISGGGGSIDYVDRVTVITDDSGRFWVHYIPSTEELFNPVYARAADVVYDGLTTLVDFTYPAGYDISPSDLNLSHIYAVMKDDPTEGSVGRYHEVPILEWNTDLSVGALVGTPMSFGWPSTLTDRGETEGLFLWDLPWLEGREEFEGGKIKIGYVPAPYVGVPQPITYVEHNITRVEQISRIWLLSTPDNSVHTHSYGVFFDGVLPGIKNSVVQLWFKRKDDAEWSHVDLNGRMAALRVLQGALLEDDPDYTPWVEGDSYSDSHTSLDTWHHPSSPDSNTAGVVYKPVTPIAYEGGNKFRFLGNLPLPDEMDDSNVLGAYAMFGDTKTKIQASAKDPGCWEKYLLSNEVCILNARDPKDLGTYFNNSTYTPYGWRLISSDFEAASSIDTATYLTFNDINRVATLDGSATSYRAPMVSVVEGGAIRYDMYDDESVYDSLPVAIGFEIVVNP